MGTLAYLHNGGLDGHSDLLPNLQPRQVASALAETRSAYNSDQYVPLNNGPMDVPLGVTQSTVTTSRCTLSPTTACALAIE